MPSTKAAQSLPLVKRELNKKMPHDVELMIGLKKTVGCEVGRSLGSGGGSKDSGETET